MRMGRRKVVIAALLALLLFATVTHAAVDITSFRAVWEGENVRVTWSTGNESDHSYFDLWRSEENLQIVNGQVSNPDALSRVNTSRISPLNPATPCSVSGNSYSIVDRGVPEDAETVYYFLESFNCSNSQSEFVGDEAIGWEVETPVPLATSTFTPTPIPPTNTPTPRPSATATATNRPNASATFTPSPSATSQTGATAQPSNTPSPTNTLPPGVTPPTATITPIPSATQRTTAATATARAGSTATRPASAPAASPTLNARPPAATSGSDPSLPAVSPIPTLTPSFGSIPESAATPVTVIESPPLFATETIDSAVAVLPPTPQPQDGSTSESPPASPDLPSVLFQPPVTQAAPTATPVTNGYEGFIRGLIGLILLLFVALAGYIGWTYVRSH